MYENNNCVTSGLITGTQWDVMLNKFIGTTNANKITFTEAEIKSSGQWENYYGCNLTYTGRSAVLFQNNNNWYLNTWSTKQTNATINTNVRTEYTAGASKATEAYHTYDVAGNVWEWTEEVGQSTNYRVHRGGSCGDIESNSSACFRHGGNTVSTVYWHLGFRTVLYIK